MVVMILVTVVFFLGRVETTYRYIIIGLIAAAIVIVVRIDVD